MNSIKYSKLFGKTQKSSPKDASSINHQLLVRGGFMDQLASGSWTLLPLGWRVVGKINQIIREEMNATGAQEMLMPLMHPKEIWNETGRWESAKEVMYQLKDTRGREFALAFTHEEIVMDLIRKFVRSYQDLPVKIYHFSTKFRNELRAKSGILRSREFLMKDLYSVHETQQDLMKYYQEVSRAYLKAFERIGLKVIITEADGGVFTQENTHEFQVIADSGEDIIFYCTKCDWGQNGEIFKGKAGSKCPGCGQFSLKSDSAIEVGNIFPLGEFYSKKMGVTFTDENGRRQTPWFGSYGIGPSRVMGAIVEVSHDDGGIIWPSSVAPYQVHLISLQGVSKKAQEIYQQLEKAGVEVLWDDRDGISAGIKFADADLIGIPFRAVVSRKTGDKIEIKKRGGNKAELVDSANLINLIAN